MPLPPRVPRLEFAIDRVLELIADTARKPAAWLPRRLGGLFKRLAAARAPDEVEEIQDTIWALWSDHADPALADLLHAGGRLLTERDLPGARAAFDAAIKAAPDWAEAWNKRAITRFIAEDEDGCLADIAEVLAREPRHFGALSGFGQVALRNGYGREALVAFRRALELNPHLKGVSEAIPLIESTISQDLN
jgi:tetratricopeptide (TPR) repeat protein